MGETLRGSVNVSVDEAVDCEGLDLELLYVRRDHHQGELMVIGFGELEPEYHTRATRVRLFSGRWEPGEHTYAFAIPVPLPASYDGQLSSWSWVAYARANIPWATDAAGRAPFRVKVPAGARTRYTPQPVTRSGGESAASTLAKHGFVLIGAPLLGMGLGSMIGGALELQRMWPALAGAVLGLMLAVLVLRSARAQASLRGPELEVAVLHPGDGYRASADARQTPVLRCRAVAGGGTAIEHVYISLAVREATTERAGGNRRYDRPRHKELLRHEERLSCTADDVYTCELPLPDPGALPFSTGRDQLGRGVIWEVTARVVRESDSVSSEHTTCEIDVQPELS